MSAKEELLRAVEEGEQDRAVSLVQELLEAGEQPAELVEELTRALRRVGERFERFELFLPEMMMAADAMTAVMAVLGPRLGAAGQATSRGKVVIGSAKGDLHEIGKDIVITMLKANGFEVVDLGRDVDALQFLKAAEEVNADIIGISTLMTTTMPGAAAVIKLLEDRGVRSRYRVMVGGAPTNAEWASEIGADGWAPDAVQAVTLAEQLVRRDA